ncbi:MAG: M48 family metallopeptidase [Candidatus Moraniibacteriota bacterium]|jgi:predicted metal-dependent hydrolase
MLQNIVKINDKNISYTLKKRKYQRQINFIIHQDGSLIVTAPKMCNKSFIEKALVKNGDWIIAQIGNKNNNITIDKSVVKHMKKACRPIIESKLLQFNSYYNFKYNRVSIRHQKTRWGSCSSYGNLNFNCKLMCISNELRDYVVVHELCHLAQMNHSKQFWQLVEKTIPNHKELRRELKNLKV